MIQKMFTVHDVKIEAYLPPFTNVTRGAAVRSFTDTLKDSQHPMARHPEDYTLLEIGEYDDSTGRVEMYEAFIPLGSALDFLPSDQVDYRLTDVGKDAL